jgi:hypothetical protein
MLHNNAQPNAAWTYHRVIFIHVFGLLQKALEGCTFTQHSDVQVAVAQCFRQQPKDFFADRIHKLVHQLDSCQNACGDFVLLLQYLHL